MDLITIIRRVLAPLRWRLDVCRRITQCLLYYEYKLEKKFLRFAYMTVKILLTIENRTSVGRFKFERTAYEEADLKRNIEKENRKKKPISIRNNFFL